MKHAVPGLLALLVLLCVGAPATASDLETMADIPNIEDVFDSDLYMSLMACEVGSVSEIIQEFEWQQSMLLPLAVPDPHFIHFQSGGLLPLDPTRLPDDFLSQLVAVEESAITTYPITVYEDPLTRERIILNAADKQIASEPAPWDYDPLWLVKERYPTQSSIAGDATNWLVSLYDPSRIAVSYSLILEADLLNYVWQRSIQAALAAEEGQEGGVMMLMGGAGYSNLLFAAAEPGPATNGIVLTIGYPDDMTNTQISIFACTNLLDPDWSLIAVTNTPSSTNVVQYLDTDATNYPVRFYHAACLAGSLHPQASDFDAGKEGRIMISTLHDDVYYTSSDTTIAGQPAQSQDAQVTITAHLPTFCTNQTVYFRVVTPDPDDASSYETNSIGGDNHDTNIVAGVLSSSNDVAELATISGEQVAAAEVTLTITDQYAGDNYQVEFSLDADFSRILDQTAVMVAWKRIYIEEDTMYKAGALLQSDFTPDGDALPDSLTVTDGSEFSAGNTVLVFDAVSPLGEEAVVSSVSNNTLYLDIDLTNSYNAGYGASDQSAAVAIPDPDENGTVDVFDANVFGRLTNAYGYATSGSDGGCFVEFILMEDGGGCTPYDEKLFLDQNGYSRIWFKNRGKTNYIHALGACEYFLYVTGKAGAADNFCMVFIQAIQKVYGSGAIPTVSADVMAHEMGHQFSLPGTDNDHASVYCHEGPTDYCVMDYDASDTDSVTEFCLEGTNHLHMVRDYQDAL